jgi:hypothetical protein
MIQVTSLYSLGWAGMVHLYFFATVVWETGVKEAKTFDFSGGLAVWMISAP